MLVALGALTIARAGPTAAGWASLGALLLAAVFVEAFPVPIKGVRAGGISLAAVFIVATGCMYGWGAAAVLGAITRGSVELAQRRPWMKISYNAAVYAISAAGAGVIASYGTAHTEHVAWFASQVIAAAATFYVLNVVLVALAGQHFGGEEPRRGDRADGRVDGRRVRHDGVRRDHALRPLGPLAAARGDARRPVSRDRALPAVGAARARGDRACADRSDQRSRESPPLPAGAGAAARRGRRDGHAVDLVPARRRRVQVDQRLPRSSRRRQDPRPGRREPARRGRGVPSGRRRVRRLLPDGDRG